MKQRHFSPTIAATILAAVLFPGAAIAAGKCDAPKSNVEQRACAKRRRLARDQQLPLGGSNFAAPERVETSHCGLPAEKTAQGYCVRRPAERPEPRIKNV